MIRFEWLGCQWPWCLAQVVDYRTDQAYRDGVLDTFYAVCQYCLDPGFGRVLRKRFPTRAEARQHVFTTVLLCWAASVDGSTFDIELMHGHGKRRSTDLTKYEIVAARHINSQAKARGLDSQLHRFPSHRFGYNLSQWARSDGPTFQPSPCFPWMWAVVGQQHAPILSGLLWEGGRPYWKNACGSP